MQLYVQRFLQRFQDSFEYYYLAYVSARCAAIILLILIWINGTTPDTIVLKEILTSCGLAFPLFVALPWYQSLAQKKHSLGLLSILTLVLVLLFWRYLHSHSIFGSQVEQSVVYTIVLSYLIAWSTLLGGPIFAYRHNDNAQRQARKQIIVFACVALLSSAILRGGIAASLGSLEYLFDLSISDKYYQAVGVVSFLIIGVSIFLSNISRPIRDELYPRFFRFFGVYIFFPLALIYSIILLAYGINIVISGVWPKGMVSWMVIGYTIWGCIAVLLTYPLGENSHTVRIIHRIYFVSLLLFVALLFGAVQLRVQEYGITQARYLLVMVGIRIVLVAGGSVIWRTKFLALVVGVFIGLAINSAYLPRGAHSSSLHSQQHHLEQLLHSYGFRDGEHIVRQEKNMSDFSESQKKELGNLANTIDYLHRNFGPESIIYLRKSDSEQQSLITQLKDEQNFRRAGELILHQLGLSGDVNMLYYPESAETNQTSITISPREDQNHAIDVSQFNTLLMLNSYSESDSMTESGSAIEIQTQGTYKNIVRILRAGQQELVINFNDLGKQFAELQNKGENILQSPTYTMIIRHLYGEHKQDTFDIQSYDTLLLLP